MPEPAVGKVSIKVHFVSVDPGLYMEVREKASGTLWMRLGPVTKEDFASLGLSEEYELQFPMQTQGAMEVMVNKAHVLGFEAGRTVSVLRTSARDLWSVSAVPTLIRTFWCFETGRSFQGPVTLAV